MHKGFFHFSFLMLWRLSLAFTPWKQENQRCMILLGVVQREHWPEMGSFPNSPQGKVARFYIHLLICYIKDNLIFSSEDCNQVEIVVIKMWCFAHIGTNCAIWKTQKTPTDECCFYLSCRLKPATLLKMSLVHECSSRFFTV